MVTIAPEGKKDTHFIKIKIKSIMSKITKSFQFDAPIVARLTNNAVVAYARVNGNATYVGSLNDDYNELLVSFSITNVTILKDGEQSDWTVEYNKDVRYRKSGMSCQIFDAALAHMEYLFFAPDQQGQGESECTDLTQNERPYSVVAIAGTFEQLANDKKVA